MGSTAISTLALGTKTWKFPRLWRLVAGSKDTKIA